MTDTQIAAVEHGAVPPAQRLVVALVNAARAGAIRELTLADVDLAGRRITRNGSRSSCTRRCSTGCTIAAAPGPTPRTGTSWSPRSPRPAPRRVSAYYLSWHLLLHGVQLEQIRGDRVLHEAITVRADPLDLAAAFHLSSTTAIAYADIARSLLERPIEAATPEPVEAPAPSPLNP